MVVAAAATRNPTKPRKSSSPSPGRQDPQNPCRLPLIPSEKDNAGDAVRRSRTKEISSRNLSSFSSSSASSNSTSYSAASNFSSPSSSSSSRRFPSPFANFRPSTPPALRQSSSQKRSCSADRARPSTPAGRGVPREAEPSVAANTLCTTTRSLSVSFQGESFFYQTSRAKTVSPSTPTPERRRPVAAVSAAAKTGDHLENSRPFDSRHRWPASRALPSNSLMRSSSCSSEKKEQILATVRLLHQTMLFDDSTRRISFDGGDLSASSDTDSVSSGSNSGTPEFSALSRAKVTSRGISVPARYRQEINSRLRQYPEPCSPSPNSKSAAPKWSGTKKLSDSPLSYPSSTSSPLRGPMRPPSPSKLVASRGMSSPQRTQTNVAMSTSPIARAGNAPSIISFAAEVRRAKKGENRIEEAHLLRLLDNRHLQWRCVNSRANAALILQKLTIEKNIYNAWTTTSELRDSITTKRIELQLLTQNLKLASIFKEQLAYLEEWSVIDTEHSSLLLGAIEALKASTLRLPIVSGAKMDILELKDSVGSAVDMMQAMGSSIRSLLSKVQGTSILLSDITKLAAQERALLDQSRNLLSTAAAMHVKQCSLQGHLVQLKRKASRL
ncbi:QWRF motif-containing protein 2-like isoform X2 [Zingiber officinale]|uniref:QWRF motif-containing protein 2-like isoform X2 n=1 Tax=Zingiber officinale TaxID=94328 RepID=UPI001C4CE70B|nr:QWRF motif-containing protein 2-like isoform X2 [Zingiber officinale]